MVKEHPQLAEKHLLQPLLTPLLRCSDAAGNSWRGDTLSPGTGKDRISLSTGLCFSVRILSRVGDLATEGPSPGLLVMDMFRWLCAPYSVALNSY